MKEKNVPELRFKGFEGEWENSKLSNLCSKISDGLHSTPIYDDNGDYYFVNGNNFVDDRISIGPGTKRVSRSEYDKHKKDISNKTIFLSINGTIGNLAWYRGEKIILGKSACYINLNSEDNRTFVFQMLKTSRAQDYFTSQLTGTTIKNLSLDAIKKLEFALPTVAEQKKIASFLTAVDEKLQALKKKKSLLEAYKKGMMQQIFSQELRFKDKDGKDLPDWTETTLGDVCEIVGGGTPPTEKAIYWNGDIQWFTPAEIKSDFVSTSKRTLTLKASLI
jgi:type I restriction enzyme S subunit